MKLKYINERYYIVHCGISSIDKNSEKVNHKKFDIIGNYGLIRLHNYRMGFVVPHIVVNAYIKVAVYNIPQLI